MSKFTTLQLDIEGAVARIWLDRPELRNAFDDVVIGELSDAFEIASTAPDAVACGTDRERVAFV